MKATLSRPHLKIVRRGAIRAVTLLRRYRFHFCGNAMGNGGDRLKRVVIMSPRRQEGICVTYRKLRACRYSAQGAIYLS